MSSLSGKVIIVTGGASGIGLATVQKLASLNAIVIAGDLAQEASQLLKDIIDNGGKVHYFSIDVSIRHKVQNFVAEVLQQFGRVDGLVNNAGICPNESIIADDEVFDRIMSVNLKGVWHVGTEVIRIMDRQDTKGVIVNMASDAALKGIKGLAAYTASKHGVLGLTRAWCKDWTPNGIRVNAVCPGVINTPMVAGISASHETGSDKTKAWLANIPMGRFGNPSEIASVVCFLLSDESSYMSGQYVRAGGGEGP